MANLRADFTPPPPVDDDASAVNGIGIGIGDTTYSVRACVARDLMLAFDQLQPGDVLVAPVTGPSVNSLLPMIGAHRATSRIPHGAQVEVDPAHCTVRLL